MGWKGSLEIEGITIYPNVLLLMQWPQTSRKLSILSQNLISLRFACMTFYWSDFNFDQNCAISIRNSKMTHHHNPLLNKKDTANNSFPPSLLFFILLLWISLMVCWAYIKWKQNDITCTFSTQISFTTKSFHISVILKFNFNIQHSYFFTSVWSFSFSMISQT